MERVHRLKRSPASGYCRYSWDDESFPGYSAHGTCHPQPSPTCPDYDAKAINATKLVTSQVARRVTEAGSLPPVEILLDSGNGNTSWAATLSMACSPLPRVPRIAKATTTNSRASSLGQSTPSTVPVPTSPFASQSHSVPARTDIMGERSLDYHSSGGIGERSLCGNALFRCIRCTLIHVPGRRVLSL